jgi:hypothetical protein
MSVKDHGHGGVVVFQPWEVLAPEFSVPLLATVVVNTGLGDENGPGAHVAVGHSRCKVHVYSRYFGGEDCCAGAASEVDQLRLLDMSSWNWQLGDWRWGGIYPLRWMS